MKRLLPIFLVLCLIGCNQQAKKSSGPNPQEDPIWNKTELRLCIDPALEDDTDLILDAAEAWRQDSGINFVIAEDMFDCDVIISYNPYLVFEVYAITINYYDHDRYIDKSHMCISITSVLLSDEETRLATYKHEFGHVLGLDHSEIKSDLMYGSQNDEQTGDLTENDRLRIKTLYGKEN